MALCVRFVDSSRNIREEFVYFTNVPRITGEVSAADIKNTLEHVGLAMEDIRGQGYDGASNMSSSNVGVQARVKEYAPLATYVQWSLS